MNPEPTELLDLAAGLVAEITPTLIEAHDRSAGATEISFRTKSSKNDIVTEMDEWCERTLVEGILASRPDDGLLGEEGTAVEGVSGVRWVIDPIDGTTNYLYDLPGYSVSVAAQIRGETVAAVVADPVRNETYTAVLGSGATINGVGISSSKKSDLSTALLATGFNYDLDVRRQQTDALIQILPVVRDLRRFGGAALDICLVASGRVDGYYEAGLSIWDVAAALLIATESGAVHTDIGGDVDLPGTTVVSSPAIHDELLNLLERSGAAGFRPTKSL